MREPSAEVMAAILRDAGVTVECVCGGWVWSRADSFKFVDSGALLYVMSQDEINAFSALNGAIAEMFRNQYMGPAAGLTVPPGVQYVSLYNGVPKDEGAMGVDVQFRDACVAAKVFLKSKAMLNDTIIWRERPTAARSDATNRAVLWMRFYVCNTGGHDA